MLTTAEIDRYAIDGYLPGHPLLTAEETAFYRAGCEQGCGPMQRDGTRRQSTNRVKPYLLFPWAAALVRHQRILDCVEALIGPDIMVFHTTVWLKEPHSETFVPWHQDATYFGLAPFEHVTAWVALTDSTAANGCVQIIPGSHTTGQRPHFDQPDPKAMLSRGQTLADAVDESRAVALHLAAGEVSFHHTLAFHRSGEPHRGAAHRHRRQLHPDPRAPCRHHAPVGHAGARHRRLRALRPRAGAAGRRGRGCVARPRGLGRPLLEGVREHPGDGNGALSAAP